MALSSNSLAAKLQYLEETLAAILAGEKPPITKSHPLYEQFSRMHEGFFTPETAWSYFTLQGDTAEAIKYKGKTHIHPLGHALLNESRSLRLRADSHKIKNYKIFGEDYGFRTNEVPLAQEHCANGFVLTRGDVCSLYQFVCFLNDRVQDTQRSIVRMRGPIVIQNSEGFWDPILGYLDLKEKGHRLNVHVSHEVHGTCEIFEKRLLSQSDEPGLKGSEIRIEPGSVILVASSKNHKVHEDRAAILAQNADVRVLPAYAAMEVKPVEAREESHSLVGNDEEKYKELTRLVDGPGRAAICERLLKKGVDPKKTYVLFDDRGMHTAEDLVGGPEFSVCDEKLNRYKTGPAEQMAEIFKAMPHRDMYKNIGKAAARIAKEREAAGLDPTVDMTAIDQCVLMLTPLLPDEQGRRPVLSLYGAVKAILHSTPRPNAGHVYSEHFLEDTTVSPGARQAEISGFVENRSAMAQAVRGIVNVTGMDTHKPGHKSQFAHLAKKRWTIGSQHSLAPDLKHERVHGHGIKRPKTVLGGDFRFVSGNRATVLPMMEAETLSVLHANGTVTKRRSQMALNSIETYARICDSFLLGPDTIRFSRDENFFLHGLIFSSLVVGNQIFDPAIHGKPFVIVKSPTWEPHLNLYDHLHARGFVGEKPHHIFDLTERPRDAACLLKDRLSRYIPPLLPQTYYTESGEWNSEGLFRVTVYCSATSSNKILQTKAHRLAYRLAEEGFAVINGGGKEGLMFQTSQGVHDYRMNRLKDYDGPVPINRIMSVQCEGTYQSEGVFEDNDAIRKYPTIYQRMHDLQDTDMEIALEGGEGTCQEIFGSGYTRQMGIRPVKNRPFAILNDGGLYNPLLEMFPRKLWKDLNFHSVNDVEHLVQMAVECRAKAGLRKLYRPGNRPTADKVWAPI